MDESQRSRCRTSLSSIVELIRLQTCDACRLRHTKCKKRWSFHVQGHAPGCSVCFEDNNDCTYQLVALYRRWLSLPLASPLHRTGGLSALPLQSALESVSVTQEQQDQQGYQGFGRAQHPTEFKAGQSIHSLADWVEENQDTPDTPSHAQPVKSEQLLPEPGLCPYYLSHAETLLT